MATRRSCRTATIRAMTAARVLTLAAVLGACALTFNQAGAVEDLVVDKDERFITAQTSGILDIEGGECFDDPAYLVSAGEKVVRYRPCTEKADNQVYGFKHAADGPWEPATLTRFAWDSCGADFARRWAGAAGRLDFYPVMPTNETWADGDRDVMCVVYNPRGKLTNSVLPLNWPVAR
jgi:hypothetical protein